MSFLYKPRPTDEFIINVECSICGKRDHLTIRRDGKFVGNDIKKGGWGYWGKVHINPQVTEPFFYSYKNTLEGPPEKIKNPDYKPRTPRLFADYFECPACIKKAEREEKRATRLRGWLVSVSNAV